MIKIVFTGPESSGKTTISEAVAKKFNLPIVAEYARKYLTQLKRPYKYTDLVEIAKGQLISEQKKFKLKTNILICDTNLQVIKIWSYVKYKKCDSFILKNQDFNCFYVLCYPDFEWVSDPFRENKNNQNELFKEYHKELKKNKCEFIIIKGPHKKRMSTISDLIQKMI